MLPSIVCSFVDDLSLGDRKSEILSTENGHRWDRVLFDDAHFLCNKQSLELNSGCLLESCRVCTRTGTTIINSIDELQSSIVQDNGKWCRDIRDLFKKGSHWLLSDFIIT